MTNMKMFLLTIAILIAATPAIAGECSGGSCVQRPVVKAKRCRCWRPVIRRRRVACNGNCGCVEALLSTPEGREKLHKMIHEHEACTGKACK